jgi:predicted alpha-1,6-mannanase (GH76 family)
MMYYSRASPLLTLFLAYTQIPLVSSRSWLDWDAISATRALQNWYNETNGLYQTTGWWNSANCITMLADLTSVNRQLDIVTGQIWPNTFEKAQKFNLKQSRSPNGGCETTICTRSVVVTNGLHVEDANPKGFLNGFYDDEGWWALAWIKVYDLTKSETYLKAAADIFEDMKATGYPATCGGIWWDRKRTHNTAIANELFLSVAAHLANRRPNKEYYVNWAKKQWDWFDRSGLINSNNTINDGLNIKTCKNDEGIVWSYNQGVVLGALVELHKAAPDGENYLRRATDIANGAIKHLSTDGILHDPREPNLGGDGYQFKGVFVRNLQLLYKATGDQSYKTYLEQNAQTLWDKARDHKDNYLGAVWSGPFEKNHSNAATQCSGLDALVAAAAVQ